MRIVIALVVTHPKRRETSRDVTARLRSPRNGSRNPQSVDPTPWPRACDSAPSPQGKPMIVEYIRYTIPADRRDAFEGGYAEAQSALDESPHCLGYELARCVEDPTRYTLRIEWTSAEGHMEGFRKSAEFRRFFAAIRPFVGDIEEMRHYEVTAVRGRKEIAV